MIAGFNGITVKAQVISNSAIPMMLKAESLLLSLTPQEFLCRTNSFLQLGLNHAFVFQRDQESGFCLFCFTSEISTLSLYE